MSELSKIAKNNVLLAKEKALSASKIIGDQDSARSFGMLVGMSVELSFKAIIASGGVMYRKIHDLSVLYADAMAIHDVSRFKELINLSDFIVASRYEFDGDWEVRDSDGVMELVNELIDFAEECANKKGR